MRRALRRSADRRKRDQRLRKQRNGDAHRHRQRSAYEVRGRGDGVRMQRCTGSRQPVACAVAAGSVCDMADRQSVHERVLGRVAVDHSGQQFRWRLRAGFEWSGRSATAKSSAARKRHPPNSPAFRGVTGAIATSSGFGPCSRSTGKYAEIAGTGSILPDAVFAK